MKAKLVKEYMAVTPDNQLAADRDLDELSFEELIEVIDNTADRDFTPEDLRNMVEWAIEQRVDPNIFGQAFKHLAGLHPEIQQDFINGEGPYLEIMEAFFEMSNDFARPSGPGPRMN